MTGEPGDAEKEADHKVGPHRPGRGKPDAPEQGGHSQSAEYEPYWPPIRPMTAPTTTAASLGLPAPGGTPSMPAANDAAGR